MLEAALSKTPKKMALCEGEIVRGCARYENVMKAEDLTVSMQMNAVGDDDAVESIAADENVRCRRKGMLPIGMRMDAVNEEEDGRCR